MRIPREHQPSGLCGVSAYFVIAREQQRAVITIMPLGKPLIDVIEEELISASERPGEQQPRQTDVVHVCAVCAGECGGAVVSVCASRARACVHVLCVYIHIHIYAYTYIHTHIRIYIHTRVYRVVKERSELAMGLKLYMFFY